MAIPGRLVKAVELLRMPDDGYRYELVRGELRTMAPAGFGHGVVAMNIGAPLAHHVKSHGLGVVCGAETGFLLATDPDTVLAPDVAFVSRDRIPLSGMPSGFWPGAPDLAVEVLSPSATAREGDDKAAAWLDAGVQAVWVANPRAKTVTIYRAGEPARVLSETDVLDGAPVVPSFRLPVAEVFGTP
jgi:Uma2 family endonuclease